MNRKEDTVDTLHVVQLQKVLIYSNFVSYFIHF